MAGVEQTQLEKQRALWLGNCEDHSLQKQKNPFKCLPYGDALKNSFANKTGI